MNISELSKGSLVRISHEENLKSLARIVEIRKESATVAVLENLFDGIPTNSTPGTEHQVKYRHIKGVTIGEEILRKTGFVDADKKGWQLMYYYGDMRLLYRRDYTKNCASFRFMSEYQKTYTRISCHHIHQLQNIMLFLTGELEFEYKKEIQ